MMTQIRPSIRKLSFVSANVCDNGESCHLQPLPACPALNASHLQQASREKTTIRLRQRNDGIENTQPEWQFISFVKVRQVEHLFGRNTLATKR